MANKLANITYLGVAIITVALIYWSAPAVLDVPHGILLPAKQNLPQTKMTQVNVYEHVAPGVRYNTLAAVHVQYHFDKPTEQVALKALGHAKELASSIGASGLLLQQLGEDPNTKILILNAKAIR